jgi:methanogenic corrinoid protein MtbC1
MDDLLERYTNAAIAGARTDAADIAAEALNTSLLLDGEPAPARLIRELLVPSQRAVGERWQQQLCSVGEEHAATFVTESILASLTVGFEPEPDRGTLVLACAEGEWHGLPARMAAELLILAGWRVVYLGPATPARQLRTYLAGVDADVVGVSVTCAANLTGAARSVVTARKLGLPVVVGGAAFDDAPHRARAIGADALVTDAGSGFDLDALLRDRVPCPDLQGEWSAIERERVAIVRDAVRWLSVHHGSVLASESSWTNQVIDELDGIVGVVAAAVLCSDAGIVADYRAWIAGLVAGGATPTAVADVGFDAIAAVVGSVSPQGAALLAGR